MTSYKPLSFSLLGVLTLTTSVHAQEATAAPSPRASSSKEASATPAPDRASAPESAPRRRRNDDDDERPEYVADDGQPMPNGYHRTTRARRGLVIAGSIVFGISYGISAIGATASDNPRDRWLFLPVAGPLIELVTSPSCSRPDGDEIDLGFCSLGRRMLVFDTVVQSAGAAMLIIGLAARTSVFARDNVEARATKPSWAVAPMRLGQGAWGLGAAGTF